MKETNKERELFGQFIRMVVRGSVLIVFFALFALIYIPFSSSINKMFEPNMEVDMNLHGTGSYVGDYDADMVVDGIHLATGMKYDKHFTIVKNACTPCHSAKLVTQNRATRDGWMQMIRWMQATQGLPDLGKDEGKILDYLAKNYAPEESGRRPVLNQEEIEWYVLELESK